LSQGGVLIKAPSPRLATQDFGPYFTEAEGGRAGKPSALSTLKTRIGMPVVFWRAGLYLARARKSITLILDAQDQHATSLISLMH